MNLLPDPQRLTAELRDTTETIAAALIRTADNRFLLAQMRESANNRIAGEWHLPGTGVNGTPEEVIPTRLIRYLYSISGVEVALTEIIAVTDRPGTTVDGNNRFVRHIWFAGQTASTGKEALSARLLQEDTRDTDVSAIKALTGCEAKELLQHSPISHERTPIAIYQRLS